MQWALLAVHVLCDGEQMGWAIEADIMPKRDCEGGYIHEVYVGEGTGGGWVESYVRHIKAEVGGLAMSRAVLVSDYVATSR